MGGCGHFEVSAHRLNTGTLFYLPRWRTRARTYLLFGYVAQRLDIILSTRAQRRAVSCPGSSADDGMTDRGRVRVADTERVIGRPPGADHPRGATRVDLLARHNGLSN